MKYKFVELQQGSKEWIEFRRNGIGASDIPSICGIKGAYQSADDLLDAKFGIEKEHNEFTLRIFAEGHAVEDMVRTESEQYLGVKYRPVIIQSIERPEFFASLDGMSEDNKSILEVKTTRKADFIRQAQEGFCPDLYFLQIQWQLFVSDLNDCKLVIVDADKMNKYPLQIERDDAIIATLVTEADKFFERMKTGVAPTKQLDTFDEVAMRLEAVLHSIDVYSERLDELEDKKKEYASFLLVKYAAKKLENDRISISVSERAGSVNYKAIPELQGVDLEKYRGKATTQMRVALKGGKS